MITMSQTGEKCIHFMKERFAMDLSVYDTSFLEKIIGCRMEFTDCKTINEYLPILGTLPDELAGLLHQLNNSYSEFFRNPITFSFLEQIIFPQLINTALKNHTGAIRIWSAGCSAGQEPYSLAILLDDYKNKHQANLIYRIFATDNSTEVVESAGEGIYDLKSIKNTRLEFAEKYFRQNGENFTLSTELKKQVDFSYYDLLDQDSSSPSSAIFGDFDVVMCCNVLFYYQPEVQQMILQKFYRSLKPGGFLITGEAETGIVSSFAGFRKYMAPTAIFVKK